MKYSLRNTEIVRQLLYTTQNVKLQAKSLSYTR